ncbi:phosphoribosylanthranilate isomerase [Pedobacter sp.]|uniref:phosphoribosylanthranilate isomerase n=1 Tax=Pedobacter sp. TaxID=1411316 RepID=UPI003D7FE5DC
MKIKICGMRDPANIAAVAALKPAYLGFIFYPQSKRFVGNLSASVLDALPASIIKTGVFVNEQLHQVQEFVLKYKLQAVQLHGDECPNYCKALKTLFPGISLIKAFGLKEGFDFATLIPYQKVVDYFLFDTQTPDHGGSGKTFNWAILKEYTLNVPFFLSGGIGPEHVVELQQLSHPNLYGIDVNSRFETEPALKDTDKLKAFKTKLFPLSTVANGI